MSEPTWQYTGAAARARVAGVLLVPGAGTQARAVPVDRELTIGRELDCDVVLTSAMVSRHHARVWADGRRFGVQDLGSRNGTSINGRPVLSPVELQDGDRLTLGDVDLQFRLVGDAAVPPAPRQPVAPEPDPFPGPTQPLPPEPAEPSGVGAKKVLLAVLESLVGTAISQAIGTGLVGTYVLAAVAPLLGTVFALRKDGKVRVGAVVLVTTVALGVTVAGVTAADVALGRSVFPWSDAPRTFVGPPDEGTENATKVTMPKLVGETNVSAMQLLVRHGFRPQNVLMVPTPAPSRSFGRVVKTDPPAGKVVPDDAIVRVFIGTGGP